MIHCRKNNITITGGGYTRRSSGRAKIESNRSAKRNRFWSIPKSNQIRNQWTRRRPIFQLITRYCACDYDGKRKQSILLAVPFREMPEKRITTGRRRAW